MMNTNKMSARVTGTVIFSGPSGAIDVEVVCPFCTTSPEFPQIHAYSMNVGESKQKCPFGRGEYTVVAKK